MYSLLFGTVEYGCLKSPSFKDLLHIATAVWTALCVRTIGYQTFPCSIQVSMNFVYLLFI